MRMPIEQWSQPMRLCHRRNLTAFLEKQVESSQGFLVKRGGSRLRTCSQKIQSSDVSGPPVREGILAADSHTA